MAHYENTRAKRERQVYRSDKRECVIEKEREREKGIAWKEEEAKMRAEICATFAQKTF